VTAAQPTAHASAVALGEAGILIRGPSGSGKSSLALALLTADPGRTRLVADDRVILTVHAGRLVASVPTSIAGLLEIRGQGIRAFPWLSPALIRMVVDLVAANGATRMPSQQDGTAEVDGIRLPRLALPALLPDGHVRVVHAVAQI
jgi:serine kinase of HPr protein (carbohydrate metabolism regulator)